MSGIFGIVSNKNIDVSKLSGLRVWNENYGDRKMQIHISDYVFIGAKPEYMKTNADGQCDALCCDGKTIGAIDSVIFSDKNSNLSDEEYLFTKASRDGVFSLKDVNGDYAGAIWDEEKNELLLFRDHMGVRPLFYYCDDEKVVFSSDIRGITSLESVDSSVNQDWFYRNISGYSELSATDTEYEYIKCVPFGGYASFKLEEDTIKKETGHYWIPGEKKVRLKSRSEYTKQLRSLVEDSVRIRALATDHKLGGELSGGLDSGVIDVLLSKIRKGCFFFSWTPKEEVLPLSENDERLVIKDICEKAGIECNYGELTVDYDKLTLLKERSPISDEEYSNMPFLVKYAFPTYINTAQIYETASFMKDKGVKVIFSGHGGDEGASHRSNPYELFYHHEYYRYLRLMYSRSSIVKHRIPATIRLISENIKVAKETLTTPFSMKEGACPLIKKSLAQQYDESKMEPLYFAFDPAKYINGGGSRNRLDVLAFYSSCTGVRYFLPLLDYRVVDFALGIPRYLYHNWYYDRFIFREAFKDIIPNSLYKQREKEDHSYKNLPKEAKEHEKYDMAEVTRAKRRYADMLDRAYWKDMIDFDVLDNWVSGNVKEEDEVQIFSAVKTCIQVEHMVRRSREV